MSLSSRLLWTLAIGNMLHASQVHAKAPRSDPTGSGPVGLRSEALPR
jgi:hypothetical protein